MSRERISFEPLLPLLVGFSLLGAPAAADDLNNTGNLPAQAIGTNDLLSVTVYGSPELTRAVRVGAAGEIRLPLLNEPIHAAGRIPAELETLIAKALTENKVIVDPYVTVAVTEYRSHPISVAGAVKAPLTFQAMGKTTLLEALTRAQGLSPEAGPEILVSRPSNGDRSNIGPSNINGVPLVTRVPVKGLIEDADPAWNLPLEGGEEIRVPQVGKVFVVGNVKRPGGFRVEDGGAMTVLKALALAEGLSSYSAKVAYVFRKTDGKSDEIPVELRKIMERKTPDVALGPNDIFYVPDNRQRRATMTAVERAIGFATATASGALILSVNR
jgi:polysaccharide export outer membrane protein